MVSKAEALAAAKQRIISLQKQMTARILDMAAEVEKLTAVATEREARQFLRATCNMPSAELSTYVGFKDKLKGYEKLLETSRVSFPVLKALVGADAETRAEVLDRMEVGARIDTKEVASIRRHLMEAQLTPGQVMAKRNGRQLATAARKNLADSLANFQSILRAFAEGLMDERDPKVLESNDAREGAARIRTAFESFFGADHAMPENLKPGTGAHELSLAFDTLKKFENGGFQQKRALRNSGLLALLAFSGHAFFEYKSERRNLRKQPPAHHRLKVIELCAGAGGMAIGLERAGFDHVALVEYDKHAAATLRLNRPDWNVIESDMKLIDFRPYRQMEIDLVSGGIPCQPYSSDGYGLGKDDPRDLFPEAVRVISEVRPRAFLFENVDGLLHARHADHVANFLRGFSKAGYQVEIHRMKAEHYGIAQERSRVLIVGVRRISKASSGCHPLFRDAVSTLATH